MPPDGTNVVPVLEGLATPNQVAVDPAGKKLYFSTSADGMLRRANLDCTNVETLATSQGTIVSIQLDLAERRIYWLNGGGPVRRANLDGTDPQIVIANTQGGKGLAIDFQNAKLYYSSSVPQAINRTNLDGTNPENVVTGVQNSSSLAVNSAPNVTRGGTIDLDGEEVTISSITHRAVNAGGRLLSSTGYIATSLKLSDGRVVLAVLAE